MPFLNDSVYDDGLSYAQTNGTRLDVTNAEATTYTEATSTFTVGNDTVTTGAPEDNSTLGRKVVVPAITAGSITATDTATHWALTDGTSIRTATNSLSASQAVTSGNTFTLDAIDLAINDATSV